MRSEGIAEQRYVARKHEHVGGDFFEFRPDGHIGSDVFENDFAEPVFDKDFIGIIHRFKAITFVRRYRYFKRFTFKHVERLRGKRTVPVRFGRNGIAYKTVGIEFPPCFGVTPVVALLRFLTEVVPQAVFRVFVVERTDERRIHVYIFKRILFHSEEGIREKRLYRLTLLNPAAKLTDL